MAVTSSAFAENNTATLLTVYTCERAARLDLFAVFEEAELFVETEEGVRVLEFTESEGKIIRQMVSQKVGCTKTNTDVRVDVTLPYTTKAIISPDSWGITVLFRTPIEQVNETDT